MAIRPADLQLAYLAAPQNAAQVSSAQQAPQNAQQAAQAAFASQVTQREEQISETEHAEGTHLRANPDGGGNGDTYTPERHAPQQQAELEEEIGFAADGDHFIDFTA
jgi:hypothetical protein